VHPVAGRCKHCRADLAALRAAAAAAMPTPAPIQTPMPIPTQVQAPMPAPTRPPVSAHPPRWRLALAAALVLALSIASGVVAHRVYARVRGDASPARDKGPVATASQLTNDADHDSSSNADPDVDTPPSPPAQPPDPDDDPDMTAPFGLDPFALLDPLGGGGGLGGGGFGLGLPHRSGPPDLHDVDGFVAGLGDTVCHKLMDCGVLPGGGPDVCGMLAPMLSDPETAERVRRGECRYDQKAAGDCLAALGGMKCDGDPDQLLAMAPRIGACVQAVDCD
jgi:hypothetical protein